MLCPSLEATLGDTNWYCWHSCHEDLDSQPDLQSFQGSRPMIQIDNIQHRHDDMPCRSSSDRVFSDIPCS